VPGDHPAITLALAALAIVEELRANLGHGLEIIDRAVRLADQSPQRWGHRNPLHLARGSILMGLDRLQDARSTLQTGRRISEELGVRWRLPFYQAVLGMERFLAGEWDDALAELEEALELAAETGERYSLVLTHTLKALIALHRGELRQAEEAAATAERELAGTSSRFRTHWAAWARALLLEAEGATGEAFATLAGCWDECAGFGLAVEYPVIGADLVRLALAAGEPARAGQVAAAVAEVADRNQVASLAGAALRCRGLADDDPEVLRAAVTPTGAALAPWSWPWPPRTRARPSPAGASPRRPCPCSGGPWSCTSGSTRPAAPPGSRPPCARWGSAAAAAGPASGPGSAGPASPAPSVRWWTWSSRGCLVRESTVSGQAAAPGAA